MKQLMIIESIVHFRKSASQIKLIENSKNISIFSAKGFQYFQTNTIFSVCEKPIYIEAREKLSKIDWTGSDSMIIHQVKKSKTWAYGVSNHFG